MASLGATDTATALDSFFIPCDRLRRKFLRMFDGEGDFHLHDDEDAGDEEHFLAEPPSALDIEHVRLRASVSLNDILASDAGVTWKSFFEFFEKKVVWLTDDTFLYPEDLQFGVANPEQCFWTWTIRIAENTACLDQTLFCTPEDEHEVSEFLIDLAAKSTPIWVFLKCGNDDSYEVPPRALPLQGRSLVHLWARTHLGVFVMVNALLSVAHWQALETVSRSDLDLSMRGCELLHDDESHRSAMVQCLRASKGPNFLNDVYDVRTLSRAITGNTRITTLGCPGGTAFDEDTLAVFGRALFQMRGLTKLIIFHTGFENCITLFPMLEEHPTLTKIVTSPARESDGEPSAALKAELTSVLVNVARTTPSLKKIDFISSDEFFEQVRNKIAPYLETNIHRPRVKAIAKIKCDDFRRKVLGRALASVSSDPNLLWMYLSENADAVFFAGHVGGGKRKRKRE